jgi:tRNA threonylcarbamoyladenosine biosynthesis protein TsaB
MSIISSRPKSNKTILALDTASRHGSIALYHDDKLTTRQLGEAGLSQTQASILVPELLALLDERNISFQEIDIIATPRGPGSFTGLRIGLATTQGFLLTTHAMAFVPSTFEIWAHLACKQGQTGKFVVALDTRRESYYSQIFSNTDPVEVIPIIRAPAEIEQLGVPVVLDNDTQILAQALVEMAQTGTPRPDVTPLYVHNPEYRKKSEP